LASEVSPAILFSSAADGLKPPGEKAAHRLVCDSRIASQYPQQDSEPVGSRALKIQEDCFRATNDTRTAGQIAQRLLPHVVADITGELQGFLEQTQRVIHLCVW
jgi:hypothetical protein